MMAQVSWCCNDRWVSVTIIYAMLWAPHTESQLDLCCLRNIIDFHVCYFHLAACGQAFPEAIIMGWEVGRTLDLSEAVACGAG